jgi:hypothetical protein
VRILRRFVVAIMLAVAVSLPSTAHAVEVPEEVPFEIDANPQAGSSAAPKPVQHGCDGAAGLAACPPDVVS